MYLAATASIAPSSESLLGEAIMAMSQGHIDVARTLLDEAERYAAASHDLARVERQRAVLEDFVGHPSEALLHLELALAKDGNIALHEKDHSASLMGLFACAARRRADGREPGLVRDVQTACAIPVARSEVRVEHDGSLGAWFWTSTVVASAAVGTGVVFGAGALADSREARPAGADAVGANVAFAIAGAAVLSGLASILWTDP